MARRPVEPPPAPTAAPTPVGARYSPNTSRRRPAHSPVVPPAWARSTVAAMMFSPDSAAWRSWSSDRLTASLSRSARHSSSSAMIWASSAGSTLRMAPSPPAAVSGDGAVSVNLLTPTTVSSPSSMWRTRSAWLRTSRPFSSSMASKAPPIASTSSSSADADSTSSAVRPSTTFDPSKMSGYSSRSVSNARTCCIRSAHCWSHGRGRPSASFHAGSCSDRARPSATGSRPASRARCAARCSPAAPR